MTGFTTIDRDDIHVYISEECEALYEIILETFSEKADTIVKDINIPCKERRHNGLRCLTLFDSMVANYLVGNRKLAALLFNLIVETIKLEKKEIEIETINISGISDDNNIVYWEGITD